MKLSPVRFCSAVACTAALALSGGVAAPAARAAATPGEYVPLPSPTRVFDTRSPSLAAGEARPMRTDESRIVDVVSRLRTASGATVAPDQVSAVMVTTTVANTSAAGYVTTQQKNTGRSPAVSTVNFPAGNHQLANTTIVPVAADGTLDVTEGAGSSNVILDVVGWFTSGATLPADVVASQVDITDPARFYDSRFNGDGPLGGDRTRTIRFETPFSDADINTALVQMTAASPAGNGYLQAWDGRTITPPPTSVLNFRRGENIASFVAVPVRKVAAGVFEFTVRATGGPTHIVIDSVGDAGRFTAATYRPITPWRFLDTRRTSALKARSTLSIAVPSAANARTANTWAMVGNATMIAGSSSGHSLFWSGGLPRPIASTTNTMAGQNRASGAAVVLGYDPTTAQNNLLGVHNGSGAAAHVLFDISGRFEASPAAGAAMAKRSWRYVGSR